MRAKAVRDRGLVGSWTRQMSRSTTGSTRGRELISANVIMGSGGSDMLTGRGGADTFVFHDGRLIGGFDPDTITDFNPAEDSFRIFVTNSYPGNPFGTTTGTLPGDWFVVGTAALDANDFILYDPSTGKLFADKDGAGGDAAEHFATLLNMPTLTAADFIIAPPPPVP